MTVRDSLPGWYPLMKDSDLRGVPVRRRLAGTELTLTRRGRAAIEAVEAATGNRRRCTAHDGWVLAAHGAAPEAPDQTSTLDGANISCLRISGSVAAAVPDVAENILDTTHTSVVHKDYLRRPGARRSILPEITAGADWISATYPTDAAPGGWAARLLGAHRYTIRDTFRAPSIAEVTYTEHQRRVFCARFHLTPVTARETFVAATLAVPGNGPLAALKLAALHLFFLRVLAEDRAILEAISPNQEAHGPAPLVYAPQDILRPGIEAILQGRPPPQSRRCVRLKV
jgi:phenylpropionate dioxygenase-like ring-hydroxylating dioxygenase large terminal subunit